MGHVVNPINDTIESYYDDIREAVDSDEEDFAKDHINGLKSELSGALKFIEENPEDAERLYVESKAEKYDQVMRLIEHKLPKEAVDRIHSHNDVNTGVSSGDSVRDASMAQLIFSSVGRAHLDYTFWQKIRGEVRRRAG